MTEPRQLPPVGDPFPSSHNEPGLSMSHDPVVPQPAASAQDQLPLNEPGARPVVGTGEDEFNADDFEYVRVGGVVRAIPKTAVHDEPETATQAIPKAAMVEVVDPHFYVWLADGNVIRVKQSDLPAPAGTNALNGHWQIDNKVFLIVGIYPVEDIVKGDQK